MVGFWTPCKMDGFFGNLGPSSLKPTGQLCFMLRSIKPSAASAGWPSPSCYKTMGPQCVPKHQSRYPQLLGRKLLKLRGYFIRGFMRIFEDVSGHTGAPSFCNKRVWASLHLLQGVWCLTAWSRADQLVPDCSGPNSQKPIHFFKVFKIHHFTLLP